MSKSFRYEVNVLQTNKLYIAVKMDGRRTVEVFGTVAYPVILEHKLLPHNVVSRDTMESLIAESEKLFETRDEWLGNLCGNVSDNAKDMAKECEARGWKVCYDRDGNPLSSVPELIYERQAKLFGSYTKYLGEKIFWSLQPTESTFVSKLP